jgi:isocitrate lyase
MISVKKHFGTTERRYIYLSGWMVAALRSEFGPLPDQSMHEKTSVPALIEEIYTFLRQADARELGGCSARSTPPARPATRPRKKLLARSTIIETHVVPIIADIDAGFGNAEATYLLAKKMIEAGACALQIENQVSDEKQCGHQDGKVTVPHEDFLAKVRACRYAFLELGVEDGIIVTRTDSLGAGLTKQIAVSHEPGDLGDQYNSFLDCEEVTPPTPATATSSSTATASCCGRSACQQPVPVPRRHRRGPLRARQHHLAAERRRPAVDRNRKAAYRADRRHDGPHPRGRSRTPSWPTTTRRRSTGR